MAMLSHAVFRYFSDVHFFPVTDIPVGIWQQWEGWGVTLLPLDMTREYLCIDKKVRKEVKRINMKNNCAWDGLGLMVVLQTFGIVVCKCT